MCFQIRVVSQEVRFSASQLDELYNLFKVGQKHNANFQYRHTCCKL